MVHERRRREVALAQRGHSAGPERHDRAVVGACIHRFAVDLPGGKQQLVVQEPPIAQRPEEPGGEIEQMDHHLEDRPSAMLRVVLPGLMVATPPSWRYASRWRAPILPHPTTPIFMVSAANSAHVSARAGHGCALDSPPPATRGARPSPRPRLPRPLPPRRSPPREAAWRSLRC